MPIFVPCFKCEKVKSGHEKYVITIMVLMFNNVEWKEDQSWNKNEV